MKITKIIRSPPKFQIILILNDLKHSKEASKYVGQKKKNKYINELHEPLWQPTHLYNGAERQKQMWKENSKIKNDK